MARRIAITGIGAVTPVGLSAPTTAAALRASIARLGVVASSLVDGESGTSVPALGGRAPLEWFDGGPVPEEWPGHERFGNPIPPPSHCFIEDGDARLSAMARHAVREAWTQSGAAPGGVQDWGLFLGLGEHETPGAGERIAASIREELPQFRPALTDVKEEGRASFLHAVQRAATAISGERVRGALVGCADSLVRPSALTRLAEAGVLRDPEMNPQGILPGEGAAFLVLEGTSQRSKPR